MSQMLVWVLAILASWDTLARGTEAQQQLLDLVQLRRQLIADAPGARLAFCADSARQQSARLLWRSAGSWTSACSPAAGTRGLPRYWRIEARLKYGMLFLLELPITVSIVILA